MTMLLVLLALQSGSIQGTVVTAGTLEPVRNAVVRIPLLNQAVVADEHGLYSFPDVPAGRWQVIASSLGYASQEVRVEVGAGGGVRLHFELRLAPLRLPGIAVRPSAHAALPILPPLPDGVMAVAGPGPVRVSGPGLGAVPGVVQSDLFRALQTLPSVAAISDFSSALYMRGGDPGQTLVLLDGMPLFNPYHMGGFFSAVDPGVVASVDVHAGALSAGYGDRLGGVVDVRTRAGARDRLRTRGSASLISLDGVVEGPLPGGGGSFLAAARRSHLDAFSEIGRQTGLLSGALPYAFADVFGKITHDAGELGSVAISFYADREGLDVGDGAEGISADWGSTAVAASFRSAIGARLVADARVTATRFESRLMEWEPQGGPPSLDPLTPREGERVLHMRSINGEVQAAAGVTWLAGSHEVRTGVQATQYLLAYDVAVADRGFNPWSPQVHPFADARRRARPATIAAYMEDEWRVGERLRFRAGLRALHAPRWGTALLPRAGATATLSPGVSLSVGAGRYAQPLYSLRDEESVFASAIAFDVFVATDRGAAIPTGEDVVVGAAWENGGASIRVDAFVRRMEGLPARPPGPIVAPFMRPGGVGVARGESRGVEVIAQRRWTDGAVSVSYALAAAHRTLEDGMRYPPRFDRRHTLDVMASTALGGRSLLSGRLVVASGQPYTPAVGVAQPLRFDPVTGRLMEVYFRPLLLGEHNSERSPAYHRLDVAAHRQFRPRMFGENVTLVPFVQVINVFNTRNVLTTTPVAANDGVLEGPSHTAGPTAMNLPQLPFLPTVGFEWRF
jgi:hypothetical protein